MNEKGCPLTTTYESIGTEAGKVILGECGDFCMWFLDDEGECALTYIAKTIKTSQQYNHQD